MGFDWEAPSKMDKKKEISLFAGFGFAALALLMATSSLVPASVGLKADEGFPCGGVARINVHDLDANYRYEGEDFPTYYAMSSSDTFIDSPTVTTSGGKSLGHVSGGYFELSVRTYLDVPFLNFEGRMSAESASWTLEDHLALSFDGVALSLTGLTLTGGSASDPFHWQTLSLGQVTNVVAGWHRLRFTYETGFPNLDYLNVIADRTAITQKESLSISENGLHSFEAESVDISHAVFLNESSDKAVLDSKASGGAYLAPVKGNVASFNWGYLLFEIETTQACTLSFSAYVNMPTLVAVSSMYKRFSVTCDDVSFGNLSPIAAQTNADDWVCSNCQNGLAVSSGYHTIKLAYVEGTGSGCPKLDYFKFDVSGIVR